MVFLFFVLKSQLGDLRNFTSAALITGFESTHDDGYPYKPLYEEEGKGSDSHSFDPVLFLVRFFFHQSTQSAMNRLVSRVPPLFLLEENTSFLPS